MKFAAILKNDSGKPDCGQVLFYKHPKIEEFPHLIIFVSLGCF